MRVKLIVVGKLKEKFWQQANDEYEKRLRPYCKLTIIELKELTGKERLSDAEIVSLMDKEFVAISKHIDDKDYVCCLDVQSQLFSSEKLAKKVESFKADSLSKAFVIVIGGPAGISDNLRSRANMCLSLSPMTFTHQMARIIILEQLYRAYKILANEPYHK